MGMGNSVTRNIGMLSSGPESRKCNSAPIKSKNCFKYSMLFYSVSEDEFKDIMRVKDVDGDGFISIKEFLNKEGSASKQSDLAFQLLDK